MDKLTEDEFHTLARTGEVMLTTERNEVEIARSLMKENGWIDTPINFAKDTEAGWLKIWIDI